MELTIEEIKKKRTALAATISEAVNSFQCETGCRVERIELQTIMDFRGPINTQVSVHIVLD
jgi:hypothetical protein